MERLAIDHLNKKSLYFEHVHRYELISTFTRGVVVDCACGIGYGSEILMSDDTTKFLGFDVDAESVQNAQARFGDEKRSFICSGIEQLPIDSGTVDVFISLETLEHTTAPQSAISSVARVLHTDGMFFGSVPTYEYENKCEQVYGSNPYHIQRFKLEELQGLLKQHFAFVEVFTVCFVLGTLVKSTQNVMSSQIRLEESKLTHTENDANRFGSYFFVATQNPLKGQKIAAEIGEKFLYGLSKVESDQEEVVPLINAIKKQDLMISERDQTIASQTKVVEERWEIMQQMDVMIKVRDQLVSDYKQTIINKDHIIGHQEQTLIAKEQLAEKLTNQNVMLSEQIFHQISQLTTGLDVQCTARKIFGTIFAGRLFAEIAFDYYAFIVRLHQLLSEKGTKDVFFCSREGQLLKQMFDTYQNALTIHSGNHINSHYLEVSRRSTFLLSLDRLENETFHVLFRQYRKISIHDFLSSLSLEIILPDLSTGLGVDEEALYRRSPDLPTDSLFLKLLANETFQNNYELKRTQQQSSFKQYLTALSGDIIPKELCIVDVGWKGTIQDNLFNWMNHTLGQEYRLNGFYLGMVAAGIEDPRNTKNGVLFSAIGAGSLGCRTFNENRAIFEILLPADHGSVQSYQQDEQGNVYVVHDQFIEKNMIADKVQPICTDLLQIFDVLIRVFNPKQPTYNQLLTTAVEQHARVVYQPTQNEIDWFSTVSHVENFGVFENSEFDAKSKNPSLLTRFYFTLRLILKRRNLGLGFWIWLDLKRRALPGVSTVYAMRQKWLSRH